MTQELLPPERIRRADALRNRERVLEAARATIAEHGLDAQMPAIAARAGVGVGTVYRHFPTKEALIGALTEHHFEALYEMACERASRPGDAWENFVDQIWTSARMLVADRGMAEIFARQPEAVDHAIQARQQLLDVTSGLMARAVADGDMRTDATVADVPTMMCGLGRVMTIQHCGAPVSWERYLTLMLDGLRAR